MERHRNPATHPPLDNYMALPEHAEQFADFLKFYDTYCFPRSEFTHEIGGESTKFPQVLTCGMTPNHKTIVLRSTDESDLRYLLLSHDFASGHIEQYPLDDSNLAFQTDPRRFQFGASPLILRIDTTTHSDQRVSLEITSQGGTWTEDSRSHELRDIHTLPTRVAYILQAQSALRDM